MIKRQDTTVFDALACTKRNAFGAYTLPNDVFPNDRETFLEWLRKLPPTTTFGCRNHKTCPLARFNQKYSVNGIFQYRAMDAEHDPDWQVRFAYAIDQLPTETVTVAEAMEIAEQI